MMKKRFVIPWCAVLAMTFSGGCMSAEENGLGTFVCDFLRSALAAYLF